MKNIYHHIIAILLLLTGALGVFYLENPYINSSQLVFWLNIMFFGYFYVLFNTKDNCQKSIYVYICTSIFIQILFLFPFPYFNDFYRYLWDGKIILHGINPYIYNPFDVMHMKDFSHLANTWYWDGMYFQWLPTIYGPTAEYIFALAALVKQDSSFVLKTLFLFCNICALFIGKKLLKMVNLPEKNILIFFLNPLFLFETLISAHSEAIIIPFLYATFFVYFLSRKTKKPVYDFLLGITFSLLTLIKFFPILIAPFFITKKNWWKYILGFCTTCVLLYIPFILEYSIVDIFSTFTKFNMDWVISPGVYYVVFEFFHLFFSIKITQIITKLFFASTLIFTVLFLWWKQIRNNNNRARTRHAPTDIINDTFIVFTLLIFTSSVVFSWYTLWILCLIPFIKNKTPWIIFTYCITFQYLLINVDPADNIGKYMNNGIVWWSQLIIWGPIFTLLTWQILSPYFQTYLQKNT